MTAPAPATPVATVILAGERAGGSALAQHFNAPSSVLVPLADATPLEYVLNAIEGSESAQARWLIGPAPAVLAGHALAQRAVNATGLTHRVAGPGPAASLLTLLSDESQRPLLVTTADHALLTPQIIDHFLAAATAAEADLIAGLVPYAKVARRYPESRRTLLKLRDGPFCGANLFLLRTAAADSAIAIWRQFEAHRKTPWKLARRLGLPLLIRYLTGQLDSVSAAERLGERFGCRAAFVPVPFANAAVDVDSLADWQLARDQLTKSTL